MPSTAIISPQIVDSTSIGRDLITAADQASAQAIIGVTGVDVTANYNWTGNHDFSGTIDADAASFSGTLSAVTVAAQTNNLTLQSNSGNALINVANSGSISITAYGSIYQQFRVDGVGYRENCFPIFSTLDMGTAATPWNNGYFNNLSSAVGGTQRVYGLGTDGDADTEYIETSWDGNVAKVQAKETGTGILRRIDVSSGVTGMKAYANSTLILSSAWSSATMNNVQITLAAPTNGYVSIRKGDLRPYDTVTPINCGQPAVPWAGVYSVDGDFSGDVVMAANVDFTGLPTSDPLVAGRLWNDGGAMKISAG